MLDGSSRSSHRDGIRHVQRQSDDELASPAATFAVNLDAASVQFGDTANESQPKAEPALRPIERPIVLGKEIEDLAGSGLTIF
jgi:hypothetical protein